MLSRVADSIYWMGRYIERAENVARFIDVNLHMILYLPVGSAEQWEPLVITSGDRADMILAAIQSDAACVVITNNILGNLKFIAESW